MKKRPLWLKLLAVSIFLVPIVACLLLFYVDRQFFTHLQKQIKFEIFLLFTGSFIASVGVWRAKPWGFKIFFIYSQAIVIIDLIDFFENPLGRNAWHFVDWILASIGVLIIFRKSNRELFFNRALRWWETATRVSVDLGGSCKIGEREFEVRILNISQTGCLFYVPGKLSVGQAIEISFNINESDFKMRGRVARTTHTPDSYGLNFEFKNFSERLKLLYALNSQKRQLRVA